ncbi:HlyIII-domain-containing protein [Spinellus fusiger]|nr:HlyIII-domain-containing protein [Spinellus fusiger]
MTLLQRSPLSTAKETSADTANTPDTPDAEDAEEQDSLLNHPHQKTLTWHQLPVWMHDNIYITAGYRPPNPSYRACVQSLFYLHNESVNIWSHLLGWIGFFGLGVAFFYHPPFPDSLTGVDFAFFYVFILGALTCLGFSSLFHCFACHSEPVAVTWNRCDYAGITSLIVGSFFPIVHYGFHCHTTLQIFYLVTISVLGAITAMITLMKHFRTPAYRWIRTTMFIALGGFGVVPTLHAIYLYGIGRSLQSISLLYLITTGLSYIVGAVIYAHRMPERYSPGTFNIWLASHQIFHLFVLVALYSHYTGMMKAMFYWHTYGTAMCVDFSS